MTQSFVPQGQPNYPYPPQPPPPKKSHRGWIIAGIIVLGLIAFGSCVNSLANLGTSAPSTTPVAAAPAKPKSADPGETETEEPEPEPEPKETKEPRHDPTAPHEYVSKRTYAKILRDPDEYFGKRIIIYGEVTQFDSATGRDTFRADTAYRNTTSYGYFDGENTILFGSKKKLDDLVEGDVFRAAVTVGGSTDYDTQIGGETTVAMLQVDSIKVIGEN